MKNYKTFLVGLLGAIWVGIQPIITNGDFDIERDWKNLLTSIFFLAFGYYAKDKGVTGIGVDAKRSDDVLNDIK